MKKHAAPVAPSPSKPCESTREEATTCSLALWEAPVSTRDVKAFSRGTHHQRLSQTRRGGQPSGPGGVDVTVARAKSGGAHSTHSRLCSHSARQVREGMEGSDDEQEEGAPSKKSHAHVGAWERKAAVHIGAQSSLLPPQDDKRPRRAAGAGLGKFKRVGWAANRAFRSHLSG